MAYVEELHPWTVSVAEAREIQIALRERLSFEPPTDFAPERVAGADVAFDKKRGLAFAAVTVIDLDTMETVEEVTASLPVSFPYVPGYLSFRELPVLAAAWEKLEVRPDAAIIDAHGYAHPRRMGLACHAGLVFRIPTVGCAKSILCGEVGDLGVERGSTAPLIDRANDEIIGRAVRTRSGVRPVYVSVGDRVDLDAATHLVLRAAPGRYRFPETTRRADKLAGAIKSAI